MAQLRRAIPRQPADWPGKYRFRDDPERRWRDCAVSDISTAGGRLRLFHSTPDEAASGGQIEVLVQLYGDIRNTVPGKNNDVSVGIEFVGLTDEAESAVQALKSTGTRW
jgi:hypothetical protein